MSKRIEVLKDCDGTCGELENSLIAVELKELPLLELLGENFKEGWIQVLKAIGSC